MKVYTRRGDAGETDLFGGERVGKDHRRVAAYGAVDELNAVLGVAGAASGQEDLREPLQRIQSQLFDLGAHLATPDPAHREKYGVPAPEAAAVDALEAAIDRAEGDLEPLKTFILPGGTPAAAAFHLARTVCRRAEREVVALARHDDVAEGAVRYLNRLSDLLFVWARLENARAGHPDVPWKGRGQR